MGSNPDYRRAPEAALLDGLRGHHHLALAEAYHRSVPAAHAVARRLVGGAGDVEDVLLDVYRRLWDDPPADGPLEGWARRTTWEVAVARLREAGAAPASPSAAGLLPDLPAPEVRFLDAAERAIAELADDERQALLLAHDRGVPAAAQEQPGAADALARALEALAGPETSSQDRTALHEDGCADVTALGDWCLGLGDPATLQEAEEQMEARPGCAAKGRTLRRGRRRIEGLPATPDMGQRIMVEVLVSSTTAAAAAPVAAPAPEPAEPAAAGDATPPPAAAPPPEPLAPVEPPVEEPSPWAPEREPDDVHPSLADILDDADDVPSARATPPDVSTDELQQAADPASALDQPAGPARERGTPDWTPEPGDTAELRLSDILGEGEDEDEDDLEEGPPPSRRPPAAEPAEEPPVTTGSRNPYAALRDLEAGAEPEPTPGPAPVFEAEDPDVLAYEEREEPYEEEEYPEELAGAGRGGLAVVLAWVLPVLAGGAIGLLVALLVFQ